jgi:RNA polymerase sigma-70 factor, ECF subfamily
LETGAAVSATSTELGGHDERILVERARAGDTLAFEGLYMRHLSGVQQVVSAIIRDHSHVADAVQEAFTRALDRLPTLRDATRFRPWLLSIARHVATDHVRARMKARIGVEDEALDVATPEPGPEELAELAELSRLVRAGLAGLSKRDATAVALVTHLDFTPAEVAVALGITPGAAKVLVHRARRRLRDALRLDLSSDARGFEVYSLSATPSAPG